MSDGNAEFEGQPELSPYEAEEQRLIELYRQAYFDQITKSIPGLSKEQLDALRQTAEELATEKRDAEKHYKYDRLMDKLLTRAALDDELEHIFKAKEREVDPKGVFVFADVNNLKIINDILGHDLGDRALKIVSTTIGDGTRPVDIKGRYGGDEVLIFLENAGIEEAALVMTRMRKNLAKNSASLRTETEGKADISLSIGLVPYRKGVGVAQIRKEADEAMYVAKKQLGKNAMAITGLNNPQVIQETYDFLEKNGIKAPIVSVPNARVLSPVKAA